MLFILSLIASNVPLVTPYLSFRWSPTEFSEARLLALMCSVYEGGKLKFVGSDFTVGDFASFKEFVCNKGPDSGDVPLKAAGGGVDNGTLEENHATGTT